MPELDVFTQNELQWGALKTGVLGMFYPHPQNPDAVEFSGDVNNFVSAHKYKVFSPTEKLLNLVINSLVSDQNRFSIGHLRLTECRLTMPGIPTADVNVFVSTRDFLGARTAMFGKTRLGKSNVVKMIAQSILETTNQTSNVVTIFDINGEYANDNPQDGNFSLASAYKDRCDVYALTPKAKTASKALKINFYEHPDASIAVLASLIKEASRDTSNYIKAFLAVDLPSVGEVQGMPKFEVTRPRRKILMYWAILRKAGFPLDESQLKPALGGFDPQFNKESMERVYGKDESKWPEANSSGRTYS